MCTFDIIDSDSISFTFASGAVQCISRFARPFRIKRYICVFCRCNFMRHRTVGKRREISTAPTFKHTVVAHRHTVNRSPNTVCIILRIRYCYIRTSRELTISRSICKEHPRYRIIHTNIISMPCRNIIIKHYTILLQICPPYTSVHKINW